MVAVSGLNAEVDGRTVRTTVELVTPQRAEKMLAGEFKNRKLRQRHVDALTRAMERGEFQFVGDPVRLDIEGNLIDGQHRLAAIVQSGLAQTMVLIRGLQPSAAQFMDAGRKRSVADQITMLMDVKNAHVWAGAVQVIKRWEAGAMMDATWLLRSAPEVLEFAQDHLAELERAVEWAAAVRSTIGSGSPSVGAAVYYRAEQIDPDAIKRFFVRLGSGEELKRGMPVYALREALRRRRQLDRWTMREELVAYLRAWNAEREGRELGRLVMHSGRGLTEAHFRIK